MPTSTYSYYPLPRTGKLRNFQPAIQYHAPRNFQPTIHYQAPRDFENFKLLSAVTHRGTLKFQPTINYHAPTTIRNFQPTSYNHSPTPLGNIQSTIYYPLKLSYVRKQILHTTLKMRHSRNIILLQAFTHVRM